VVSGLLVSMGVIFIGLSIGSVISTRRFRRKPVCIVYREKSDEEILQEIKNNITEK
jgi:hypothetical protein